MRPSFTSGAAPDDAKEAFGRLVDLAASQYDNVESGRFGADMKVELINEGPVTFWLQTKQ
jgi:D-tyrosyl-tRNA(Tyr) deacylase